MDEIVSCYDPDGPSPSETDIARLSSHPGQLRAAYKKFILIERFAPEHHADPTHRFAFGPSATGGVPKPVKSEEIYYALGSSGNSYRKYKAAFTVAIQHPDLRLWLESDSFEWSADEDAKIWGPAPGPYSMPRLETLLQDRANTKAELEKKEAKREKKKAERRERKGSQITVPLAQHQVTSPYQYPPPFPVAPPQSTGHVKGLPSNPPYYAPAPQYYYYQNPPHLHQQQQPAEQGQPGNGYRPSQSASTAGPSQTHQHVKADTLRSSGTVSDSSTSSSDSSNSDESSVVASPRRRSTSHVGSTRCRQLWEAGRARGRRRRRRTRTLRCS